MPGPTVPGVLLVSLKDVTAQDIGSRELYDCFLQVEQWSTTEQAYLAANATYQMNQMRPANGQPPVTTGTTVQTYTDTANQLWVAKNGVNGGAWYRPADVLRANLYRTSAWTCPAIASPGNLALDSVQRDTYGMGAGNLFTTPIAGYWYVHYQIAITTTASGQYLNLSIYTTSIQAGTNNITSIAGSLYANISFVRYFAAGVTFQPQVFSATALAGVTGAVNTYGELAYMGSGP